MALAFDRYLQSLRSQGHMRLLSELLQRSLEDRDKVARHDAHDLQVDNIGEMHLLFRVLSVPKKKRTNFPRIEGSMVGAVGHFVFPLDLISTSI